MTEPNTYEDQLRRFNDRLFGVRPAPDEDKDKSPEAEMRRYVRDLFNDDDN